MLLYFVDNDRALGFYGERFWIFSIPSFTELLLMYDVVQVAMRLSLSPQQCVLEEKGSN